MNTDDFLNQLSLGQISPWLRNENCNEDKVCDIVIACRIRLARNLAGFPFPVRASEQDRRLLHSTVRNALQNDCGDCIFIDLQPLEQLDRDFLQERQLISPELAASEQMHAVIIDRQEHFCITLNEEDHIRIHATANGLALKELWELPNRLDDQLGSKLDYVFHEKYGFLTSCITNVGTGLKTEAMLHLPALSATGEMNRVFRSLQKANLIIRGLHGEGSQVFGDFYLISNRITLGKSEAELIAKMEDLVPQVVQAERQARDFLLKNRREIVFDQCSRALGVLRTARTISNAETMQHLSSVRFGIHTGLLEGIDIALVNVLQLNTQSAHVQKMRGGSMALVDQDIARAEYIRQRLETES
ncbi:MAG: protein arginine kinase [Planctomycetaceae bacterium]|nr:protein arginine kinase [Planctomycetaceae bacterium]